MKAILYVCFIAFILLLMFAVPQHEANACKELPDYTPTESSFRKTVHHTENMFVYNGQDLIMMNAGDIDPCGCYFPGSDSTCFGHGYYE